jgi:hypothetical protein
MLHHPGHVLADLARRAAATARARRRRRMHARCSAVELDISGHCPNLALSTVAGIRPELKLSEGKPPNSAELSSLSVTRGRPAVTRDSASRMKMTQTGGHMSTGAGTSRRRRDRR